MGQLVGHQLIVELEFSPGTMVLDRYCRLSISKPTLRNTHAIGTYKVSSEFFRTGCDMIQLARCDWQRVI